MALKLGDIPLIANSLKYGSTQAAKLLYKVMGYSDFDRNSRRKMRNFIGFPSDFDIETHKTNLLDTFSLTEFISVANLIHLDIASDKESLCKNILDALSNISDFQNSVDASFLSETEIETSDNLSNTVVNSQNPPLPLPFSLDSNPRVLQNTAENLVPETNSQFWSLLRDLSSSCRNFNGNDLYSVTRFFNDIEENFQLFPGLSDQQKLIFAKRLITGPAKTFLFSQRNLTSYDAFKRALTDEFSDTITSIEIHKQLERRKMRSNETFMQYFIAMREIANRAASVIDECSVIQYTIQGIQGTSSDKFILAGANSYSEFKEKLRSYETIINTVQTRTSPSPNPRYTYDNQRRGIGNRTNSQQRETKFHVTNPAKQSQRCFNCYEFNHISKFCPHRAKGPKCLACSSFGHLSKDCRRTTRNESSAPLDDVNTIHVLSSSSHMCKEVSISSNIFTGLVDTGSHLTLLRHSAWIKLGTPPLENNTKLLTGFGFSRTKIIGTFNSEIVIDDQIFSANISVVPNTCMNFDLILGCDVIKQANLTITPDGIIFSKISKPDNEVPNENFIMTISTDSPTFDIGSNVSPETRDKVEKLLLAYQPHKTKTANVELNITLTDDKPIYHSPRRLPFTEREIVDAQVKEWIRDGIVEPCSSPYASQVVVVRKKDGKPRVCIDYRQLNRKLVKDHYPLPLIEDILDCLQNAKIFSTLDLRNGFFHVPVNEKSRCYTSFVTNKGQFQYRYMPFGLSSCPAVFMRYINSVFRDLIAQGIVLPYLDDLVVPANNESEALERLQTVLEVARDFGLDINFKKCQFLQTKIEFLGHVVENGELSPSPSKTKAVLNYPDPKNAKDVQRFLGLSGYFRKFIPSYSTIAKPLSDLLRKDTPFQFETAQQTAFKQLKCLLSQHPVLRIFNQNSPTEIHTDASIDGLGAVLLQKSLDDNQFHPVYYMSRKTTDSERKYSSYELEVLAIIEALKKFRIYVLGIDFKIVTDCDAFVKTLNKKDVNSRIARWALYLQDFTVKVEHRTGIKMAHVDALSRFPVMLITQDSILSKFQSAQEADSEILAIKEILKTKPYNDYCLKNNILYKIVEGTELIVVPAAMQTDIIKDSHQRGHFSSAKMLAHIKQNFYIPKVKEKIEKCIANCVHCIMINRKVGKQEGYLNPIHKETLPLHTYHVDHLGPLEPTCKKYKHIFAVIDSFTKFAWLYPTKSTDTAEVIAKLELQKSIFGNPSRIISDRGSAFTSNTFQEYCKKENIQHIPVTTGLPRANGQIERLNSVIIAVLSKLSIENPAKWYSHVPAVQQIINSTVQRSIRTSPFQLLFGTTMRFKNDLKIVDLINAEFQAEFSNARDDLRNEAKQQILKVQQENRKTYNLRRRKASKYKINDLVAIKRTQFGPGLKLKPKYLGPYKIVKVKQNDTYDVVKCAFFEGPYKTSTCAEYLKPWTNSIETLTH